MQKLCLGRRGEYVDVREIMKLEAGVNSTVRLSARAQTVQRRVAGRMEGLRFSKRENFLCCITSSPALGCTQPRIQWVQGALGVTTQLHVVSKLRMVELYLHSPTRLRDNFTFTFLAYITNFKKWKEANEVNLLSVRPCLLFLLPLLGNTQQCKNFWTYRLLCSPCGIKRKNTI
jgi:hypothetical protein